MSLHRLVCTLLLSLILYTRPLFGAEFIPLGTLPDVLGSRARGVSNDGVVGGSLSTENGENEAFRWTSELGMVGLGTIAGAEWSTVSRHGVSGDGSTLVGKNHFLENSVHWWEASMYTDADGMRGLGTLPGHVTSEASAVSYDGKVIVGWSNGEGNAVGEAIRWTEDTGMVRLGPRNLQSRATDVSSDGSVVVGFTDPAIRGFFQTFVWTETTGMVTLGALGEPAVSSDGKVVVGSETDRGAIRWTEETGAVRLGVLPGTEAPDGSNASNARGINRDGSMIVGFSGVEYCCYRAFIWTEQSGMQDLQQLLIDQYDLGSSLEGWNLYGPQDISDNGQFIAGIGINPDGQEQGWLVKLNRRGDFDLDGQLTITDVDRLSEAIQNSSTDSIFDLDDSGIADRGDLQILIQKEFRTYFGDANLDGEFKSSDFVAVFEAGQYETQQHAGWGEGDWNADGRFDSDDFVVAFLDGGYEQGLRPAVAVPEPSAAWLCLIGLLAVFRNAVKHNFHS